MTEFKFGRRNFAPLRLGRTLCKLYRFHRRYAGLIDQLNKNKISFIFRLQNKDGGVQLEEDTELTFFNKQCCQLLMTEDVLMLTEDSVAYTVTP